MLVEKELPKSSTAFWFMFFITPLVLHMHAATGNRFIKLSFGELSEETTGLASAIFSRSIYAKLKNGNSLKACKGIDQTIIIIKIMPDANKPLV